MRGHKGSLMRVSLLRVSLCVDGSGSCCVLDSNINQRIYIYIYLSTEEDECDRCNYIVFCIYMDVCMYVEKL